MCISKCQKSFLAWILCGSLILLSACSAKPPSSQPESQASVPQPASTSPEEQPAGDHVEIEPCEVVYWHAMSGSRGEALEQYVQRYNDTVGKELGITVTTVFQGNEIASKVRMASQESKLDNMPDISQTVGMDIPSISKLPMVAPAENFINSANSKIKKDDIYEHFLRAFTYEDVLVGMPMNCSSLLLHYNADLLREAGLDGPPETLAELAEYTEKLTVRENGKIVRYGLTVGFERYQLVNFCTSQGSFFGDNEGGRSGPMTKVVIDEDGTLVKFLTEWQKIVDTGGLKMVDDNINEEFAVGITAMTLMSSSRIGAVKGLVGDSFDYQTAPLPKVDPGDTFGASTGGSCLVMYDKGDANRLAAAWNFIEYATSAETQMTWAQAGYIPVNKAAQGLPGMIAYYEENPQDRVAFEQIRNGNPLSQEPFDNVNWGGETFNALIDIMQRFGDGKMSVGQAADEIVSEYNQYLIEYQRVNS